MADEKKKAKAAETKKEKAPKQADPVEASIDPTTQQMKF